MTDHDINESMINQRAIDGWSVHGSANSFFKFSVPCWANRKIWNWHLFRLISLQCYKCLNCFCFKSTFLLKFIIWRRQIIFALKNNGKISKNCQNKHKKRKNGKWLPFYRFSFYVRENTKTEKQKSSSVLSLFVFCTNKHKKRKNHKWLPFLSFFLLCTKTHKNIQTETDFRSIVFRCKYDQSM